MHSELFILCATAASIGFVHTLIGPDHYLPFIVMAKARNWSAARTAVITFLCGIGHVSSSVVLGLIGVAFGIAVFRLESVESARGDIAAWLLIIFGFAYTIYGVHRAIRKKPHTHSHNHACGEEHDHTHSHNGEHTHVHAASGENITPWILFTIFVFGPCEPLIPILMYPAAKHNIGAVIAVTAIFAIATVGTMLAIVTLSAAGLSRLNLHRYERYSHALAGASLLLCGAAIKLLGL